MQNFRFCQFYRSSFWSNSILLIFLIFFYGRYLNSRIELFRLFWQFSKCFLILTCVLPLYHKVVLLFLSYSLSNLIVLILYQFLSRRLFCCLLLILSCVYADCIHICNSIHQIFLLFFQLNLRLRIQGNSNVVHLDLYLLLISLSLFSIDTNDLIQSLFSYLHYFLSTELWRTLCKSLILIDMYFISIY